MDFNVVKSYSLALLSLALEEKNQIKYKDDAKKVLEAILENEKIILILNSKKIEMSSKEKIVKKAFQGIESHIINFILVVASKLQALLIIKTLKQLISFINEKLKIVEGIVYSIDKIDLKTMAKIEQKISKMINIKVELINKIDKQLLSGIKVVVNDKVIEDNILSRFDQIKTMLLREGV